MKHARGRLLAIAYNFFQMAFGLNVLALMIRREDVGGSSMQWTVFLEPLTPNAWLIGLGFVVLCSATMTALRKRKKNRE